MEDACATLLQENLPCYGHNPLGPVGKTAFHQQEGSSKQAGVVFPGRGGGGGTRLGSQPCSSRQGNAGNAGEVEEEEEGCPQQQATGSPPGILSFITL